MTDKQIIIDSIDVSGCEFYLPYSEKCECIVDDNGNNNLFCREYRDCYYKRMYHTGQEKDIYKNENKELYKLLKAKEQECERLRFPMQDTNYAILTKEEFEQLDQLKAENEELKNRVVELSLFQLYKIQRDEAEQTLTEIKEIAEKYTKLYYADFKNVLILILQKISEVIDE